MRRRRKKNKNKILIVVLVCMIFVMTAGYAAFSTDLNINVKGNSKMPFAYMTLSQKIVTDGNGLYQDIYEDGRYVYKGQNPDNYILFNNELWRIISIESDHTLKIVRNVHIGYRAWDERTDEYTGPRLNENNTYCTLYASGYYYGCNAWSPGNYNDGVVTENASLNNYLNNEYFNSLDSNAKEAIVNHTFDIGGVSIPTVSEKYEISKLKELQKSRIVNSKVGLINLSDYLASSLDVGCTNLYDARASNYVCKNDNYLFNEFNYWTINYWDADDSRADVWRIDGAGRPAGSGIDGTSNKLQYASTSYVVFPVVFLDSNIHIIGMGTENSPYEIK